MAKYSYKLKVQKIIANHGLERAALWMEELGKKFSDNEMQSAALMALGKIRTTNGMQDRLSAQEYNMAMNYAEKTIVVQYFAKLDEQIEMAEKTHGVILPEMKLVGDDELVSTVTNHSPQAPTVIIPEDPAYRGASQILRGYLNDTSPAWAVMVEKHVVQFFDSLPQDVTGKVFSRSDALLVMLRTVKENESLSSLTGPIILVYQTDQAEGRKQFREYWRNFYVAYSNKVMKEVEKASIVTVKSVFDATRKTVWANESDFEQAIERLKKAITLAGKKFEGGEYEERFQAMLSEANELFVVAKANKVETALSGGWKTVCGKYQSVMDGWGITFDEVEM